MDFRLLHLETLSWLDFGLSYEEKEFSIHDAELYRFNTHFFVREVSYASSTRLPFSQILVLNSSAVFFFLQATTL